MLQSLLFYFGKLDIFCYQELTFHSAIPRVCLDGDPFGVLEGLDFKKTRKSKRLNFKPTMPSIAERLDDFVEAERTLRQEALASSEAEVQPGNEQPPPYEEGPLVLYQVTWPLYKLTMR